MQKIKDILDNYSFVVDYKIYTEEEVNFFGESKKTSTLYVYTNKFHNIVIRQNEMTDIIDILKNISKEYEEFIEYNNHLDSKRKLEKEMKLIGEDIDNAKAILEIYKNNNINSDSYDKIKEALVGFNKELSKKQKEKECLLKTFKRKSYKKLKEYLVAI